MILFATVAKHHACSKVPLSVARPVRRRYSLQTKLAESEIRKVLTPKAHTRDAMYFIKQDLDYLVELLRTALADARDSPLHTPVFSGDPYFQQVGLRQLQIKNDLCNIWYMGEGFHERYSYGGFHNRDLAISNHAKVCQDKGILRAYSDGSLNYGYVASAAGFVDPVHGLKLKTEVLGRGPNYAEHRHPSLPGGFFGKKFWIIPSAELQAIVLAVRLILAEAPQYQRVTLFTDWGSMFIPKYLDGKLQTHHMRDVYDQLRVVRQQLNDKAISLSICYVPRDIGGEHHPHVHQAAFEAAFPTPEKQRIQKTKLIGLRAKFLEESQSAGLTPALRKVSGMIFQLLMISKDSSGIVSEDWKEAMVEAMQLRDRLYNDIRKANWLKGMPLAETMKSTHVFQESAVTPERQTVAETLETEVGKQDTPESMGVAEHEVPLGAEERVLERVAGHEMNNVVLTEQALPLEVLPQAEEPVADVQTMDTTDMAAEHLENEGRYHREETDEEGIDGGANDTTSYVRDMEDIGLLEVTKEDPSMYPISPIFPQSSIGQLGPTPSPHQPDPTYVTEPGRRMSSLTPTAQMRRLAKTLVRVQSQFRLRRIGQFATVEGDVIRRCMGRPSAPMNKIANFGVHSDIKIGHDVAVVGPPVVGAFRRIFLAEKAARAAAKPNAKSREVHGGEVAKKGSQSCRRPSAWGSYARKAAHAKQEAESAKQADSGNKPVV